LRLICAEFKQEGNSFSPLRTTLQDFENYHLHRGAEVQTHMAGTGTEVGGFFAVAQREGVEIAPALATMAMSSGPVELDAFEALSQELLARISALLPADGILLALHGAMLVEGSDDPEGSLLARLREIVGKIPVVVSLDLHAVPTSGLLEHADAIVGFDTCPHTDLFETGARAAELLIKIVRRQVKPRMAFVRVPLDLPAEAVDTSKPGPAANLLRAARGERGRGGILSTSIFFPQPWLDMPHLGATVLVVFDEGNGDGGARETEVTAALAQKFWDLRTAFEAEFHSVEQAVGLALAADAATQGGGLKTTGPFVLSDSADTTGGGATGDATRVLAHLLAQPGPLPGDALITIVDAEAALQAARHLPGERVSLQVGGKMDHHFNQPARLEGVLRTLFHGRFRVSGPSYTGLVMRMGLTAVVEVDRLKVVITSRRTWTHTPDFYRAVGLEPASAWIVLTKSNSTFKASYAPIARRILFVAGPGVSSPELTSLPFQRRPRPLYPFEDFEWIAEPVICA
jgi:microcystin degradation protein MlrC